jgi:hypothetical protein
MEGMPNLKDDFPAAARILTGPGRMSSGGAHGAKQRLWRISSARPNVWAESVITVKAPMACYIWSTASDLWHPSAWPNGPSRSATRALEILRAFLSSISDTVRLQ